MKKRPWMPLYVSDYMADTAHLSVEEHGAYLLLIMNYWHNGGLPNDEEKLRRIAKMTARQWARSAETLKSFFQIPWKHKRIDEELAHVIEISNKRSAIAQQKHSKPSANVYTLHTSHPLAKANGARKRASTFPENFLLSDERRAVADRHGIPAVRVAGVFEHFRDHHTAKGSLMKDWDAAWRTWCKNDQKFGGRNGTSDRKYRQSAVIDRLNQVGSGSNSEFDAVSESGASAGR